MWHHLRDDPITIHRHPIIFVGRLSLVFDFSVIHWVNVCLRFFVVIPSNNIFNTSEDYFLFVKLYLFFFLKMSNNQMNGIMVIENHIDIGFPGWYPGFVLPSNCPKQTKQIHSVNIRIIAYIMMTVLRYLFYIRIFQEMVTVIQSRIRFIYSSIAWKMYAIFV